MSARRDRRALATRARNLVSMAGDLLQAQRTKEPEEEGSPAFLHLAHYTSLEALVSMLQDPKGGLRLSDSATMNDPEEGRTTKDGRVFLKLLKEQVGEDSWLWKRYKSAHICCFVGVAGEQEQLDEESGIEAGDDLLFWRLYGNQGRGVSITIPSHRSKELVGSAIVQKVTYSDEPPIETDLTAMSKVLSDLDELRRQALEDGKWAVIKPQVMPTCDQFFGQRFLHKRPHYAMEKEYRSIVFVEGDGDAAANDIRISSSGLHVQYGLVRRYVQIPELDCKSVFTTKSRITIGRNVPETKDAKRALSSLLKDLGIPAGVVRTSVSRFRYRPR